ncbi:hypothetical protein DLH72_01135 [Candidatus Gracilibacteria bacterium]|nr:MAG: hypothetical protein DLH72_01135 [Candidatus Gracilibacteria bacterium]
MKNIESVEEKKIDDKQEENIVSEDIPEWLKTGTEQENDNDVLKEQEPKLETEEELNEFTKIQLDDDVKKEDDIPDWLKGSFSQENKADKNENDEVKETKKNLKTDDFANFESLGNKEEDKKSTKKAKSKKTLADKKDEKNSKKINEDDSSDKKSLDDELWDDGMKIPDWLKTDSDK